MKCKLICLFISIYHDKNAFEEVFLFKKFIYQFLHKHEWISSLCHRNNAGCVWMAYIKYFMGQNTPSTFLRLNSFTSVRILTKLFEKGEIKLEHGDNTDTQTGKFKEARKYFFSFLLILQSVDDILGIKSIWLCTVYQDY